MSPVHSLEELLAHMRNVSPRVDLGAARTTQWGSLPLRRNRVIDCASFPVGKTTWASLYARLVFFSPGSSLDWDSVASSEF